MSLKKLIKSSSLCHILLTSGLIWMVLAAVLWLSQSTVIEYLTQGIKAELNEQVSELHEYSDSGRMYQNTLQSDDLDYLEVEPIEEESYDTFLTRYRRLIKQQNAIPGERRQFYSALSARLYLLGYSENMPKSYFPLAVLAEMLTEEIPQSLHEQIEPLIERNLERFYEHYQWPFDSKTVIQYLQDEEWLEQDYRCISVQQKKQIVSNMLGELPQQFDAEFAFWNGRIKATSAIEKDEATTCLVRRIELDNQGVLLIGQRVDYLVNLIDDMSGLRFVGVWLSLILAVILSLTISYRQMKKITEIRDTCRMVQRGKLSQRVPLSKSTMIAIKKGRTKADFENTTDDYESLAIAINQMLDRLEKLVMGIKHVSDNIAHDLMSPLTRVRSKLDMLAVDAPQSADKINHIIDDADNLLEIFNTLLRITQIESGSQREEFRRFNWVHICQEMIEFYQPAYEEKGIQLKFQLKSDTLMSIGDPNLWSQAMFNLLDNALKYTPAPGQVVLRLLKKENKIFLQIQDTGPGIDACEHDKVLQRFYRLEKHRSNNGNGLGLAFVKAVTQLHKAKIKLSMPPGLTLTIIAKAEEG